MNDPQQPTRLRDLGAAGEETVADILQRKERELAQRAAALRGLLAPVERQIEQVRKAMQAIGLETGGILSDLLQSAEALPLDVAVARALPQTNSNATVDYVEGLKPFLDPSNNLTIKQMILGALRDHFHDGATPTDLRDYMKAAYGKDIDRNSISPQLARLREQGVVEQYGLGGESKWKLTRAGVLYDHPSSWKDTDKDEPAATDADAPVSDAKRTIAGGGGPIKRRKLNTDPLFGD